MKSIVSIRMLPDPRREGLVKVTSRPVTRAIPFPRYFWATRPNMIPGSIGGSNQTLLSRADSRGPEGACSTGLGRNGRRLNSCYLLVGREGDMQSLIASV